MLSGVVYSVNGCMYSCIWADENQAFGCFSLNNALSVGLCTMLSVLHFEQCSQCCTLNNANEDDALGIVL